MATHVLSLQVGATNISLVASGVLLTGYTPGTPSEKITGYGLEVYGIEKERVADAITLWVYGATGAVVQAKLAEIEAYIALVNHRQITQSGSRCYLYLQMSSDTEVWRSEVLNARLYLEDNALRHWGANGTEVTLTLARRPYWETVTEYELELDNSSAGSKATGGVTIYNHDDATTGHDNWVTIASADVDGNLPAPLRIRLTNNTGGAVSSRNFYQAVNAFHTPGTFEHILEGEDAAGVTPTADAASSGGYYGRGTWTGGIAHSVDLFGWTLDAAQLALAAGGYFRVLVSFSNTPPSGIELQMHVKTSVVPTFSLWDGPKVTNAGVKIQDFGVIQLPPGAGNGEDGATYYDLLLVLTASYTGTSQLDVDFVQLTPADSTRWFSQQGYTIPDGDSIENNGPEKAVYEIDAATGQRFYLYEVHNNVLHVWPGRDQRLYFLHTDTSGGLDIADTWSVRAWYRPRRTTI